MKRRESPIVVGDSNPATAPLPAESPKRGGVLTSLRIVQGEVSSSFHFTNNSKNKHWRGFESPMTIGVRPAIETSARRRPCPHGEPFPTRSLAVRIGSCRHYHDRKATDAWLCHDCYAWHIGARP